MRNTYGIPQLGWYRGRMIRDGEGHPGGGAAGAATQDSGGNNSGGNSGDSGSSGSESNNTGGDFDPTTFWDGPAPDGNAAPSGESASGNGSESGTQGGENRSGFAQQLGERLDGLNFGDPVFNAEVTEEINNGNFEGFQKRFDGALRNAVRESLALQVQILRPFAEQLLEQVRSETQQTFNSRDNTESLQTLFPAAKNPVMAKTIAPIYEQALKNHKGNREAAVSETKQMLRFMAGASADDLNLDVAPKGEGNRGGPAPVYNWLDELTGRK